MKKKLGILTFHFPENKNYGAILQSYACQNFVKKIRKDMEIKLINFIPNNYSFKHRVIRYRENIYF